MEELIAKLVDQTAEQLERVLAVRVRGLLDRYIKTANKVVFTEPEAADFLGVSVATLQAWRRRRLISFTQYPLGRLRPGMKDGLSEKYSYDLADLLSFRDRFKQRTDAKDDYRIEPTIDLLGPQVKIH